MATEGSKTSDDLAAQMKALGDEVTSLMALVRELAEGAANSSKGAAREKADEIAEQMGDLKRKATESVRTEIEAIEKHIEEKPLKSALVAFLIGLFLGALMRR